MCSAARRRLIRFGYLTPVRICTKCNDVLWRAEELMMAILLEPPKGRTPNPYWPEAVVEEEDSVGRL